MHDANLARMKLSTARSLFLDHRAATKAHNTLKNYKRSLNLLEFEVGDIDLADFDVHHMDTLIGALRGRNLTAGTINNTVGNVSAFCRWARARGYMNYTQDPVSDREPIKGQAKPRYWIPITDFPRLLDATRDPLDRIIIAMGLYTMCRQSEILSIQMKHIDLDSGYIDIIVHKSGDTDRLPVSKELDIELRRWLTWYANEIDRPLHEEHYLIPGKKPIAFQKLGIEPHTWFRKPEEAVRRTMERSGMKLPDRVGLHILRRSAARAAFDELAKAGYDGALRQVQTWLHHKNSTMTEHYLGLTLDRDARDKQVRGQALFPSLQADNVVPLREVGHG